MTVAAQGRSSSAGIQMRPPAPAGVEQGRTGLETPGGEVGTGGRTWDRERWSGGLAGDARGPALLHQIEGTVGFGIGTGQQALAVTDNQGALHRDDRAGHHARHDGVRRFTEGLRQGLRD